MTQPTSAAAPVHVLLGLEVEHVAVGRADAGQVAAGGVQDALGLGRRAARVEDEQRVLGVELLGRALGVGRLADLVEPDVAAVLHLAVGVGVLDDDDVLERLEVAHHLVDLLLDRRGLALAPRAVDGDQRLGLGELHALLDRVGREAAEDDVVRRADPRAGEHRHHDLGDHRQVDPDDVALLDPEVLQRVGEPLDVAVQIGVGDVALLALLAAPVEGDPVAVAGLDVAIEAVVGGVDLAVREPLVERRVGVVEVLGRLLEPVQVLGLLDPPALPVLLGLLVDRRVVEQRVLAETPRAARTSRCRASRSSLLLERLVADESLRCLPCEASPSVLSPPARSQLRTPARDAPAPELAANRGSCSSCTPVHGPDRSPTAAGTPVPRPDRTSS